MEKTVITQEIKHLRDMLEQTIVQINKILGLYTDSENLEGIEKAELTELMRLYEVDNVKCLHRKVAYLLKPRWEGRLQKQANGRFAFASGNRVLELTCGTKLNYLCRMRATRITVGSSAGWSIPINMAVIISLTNPDGIIMVYMME